ncbi:TrkH family potassium uptake protein [Anaerococcus sp. AGMB00486]|uniref:TrkH family potassium uptake protein n=2 Tax=Anaerococcus TaxID=165779 RepID=A0ABX2NBM7_9FIRM|nr:MULTISPECIES: TrkH family potassium uptake protein [Anaerococcus]MSS78070.1 TrkH family potassium uptake protein [Anaerococcus porci]NVF12127.1 TrkH family potassium uptake protein [Anaerococcus faecalis]
MNLKIVKYSIGKLLLVLAGLLVFPLIVSFIYKESIADKINFILPIIISIILGMLLSKLGDNKSHIYTKEAMFITASTWLIFSLIGAIPLFLTKSNYPSYIDAFFEMVSGFTTSGASVAFNVEDLPHSIIFWRSFSHFIGGMGILVFTIAILPNSNKESSLLMKSEVPGPSFGKITPRLSDTARNLYLMYIILTILTIILLMLGRMNLFDSIVHAFGTAGTGGFSSKGISIGAYNSRYIEFILGIMMAVFGVNFNIYFYAITKNLRVAIDSEELKWYVGIILISSVLVFINILSMYKDVIYSLVNSFFSVSSIITTTGYVSADFGKWPLFSKSILILLMFIGGCAGSTAGGLKVSRFVILIKGGINQIREAMNPKKITINRLDGKRVDEKTEKSVSKYLVIYILIFIIFFMIVSIDMNDFETAFAAVATTFNNVGPGLGAFGPIETFAQMSQLSKFVLTLAMLLGRLEIFPVLLLLYPSTYRYLKDK